MSKATINIYSGLPWWLNGKESTCQCKRHGFDTWVGKIPWTRNWQPTPVFLPGESHGRRSSVGCSPWGHKRVRYNLVTKQQQQTFFQAKFPFHLGKLLGVDCLRCTFENTCLILYSRHAFLQWNSYDASSMMLFFLLHLHHFSTLLGIGNISKSVSLTNFINILFIFRPRSLIKMLNIPYFLISTLQNTRKHSVSSLFSHTHTHTLFKFYTCLTTHVVSIVSPLYS